MTVFATFDQQDSGCRSIGLVDEDGRRWFVKTSMEAGAIPSLRRAIDLHRSVAHEAIIPLCRWAENGDGSLSLMYPWVDGEVLYGAPVTGRAKRLDPSGPHARFRSLPVPEVLAAIDAVFDAHLAIAAAGFVAVDLYDGCLIYDFERGRIRLCDLDEYRPGPFVVDEDRLPGSIRFMAPEEFERGRTIDQRTTVFNLGRTALVLLNTGNLDGQFRGTAAMRAVVEHATRADAGDRHATVAAFVAHWRDAGTGAAASPLPPGPPG